jgi:hypothetical protein
LAIVLFPKHAKGYFMILKEAKPRPNRWDTKEVFRYALLPTRMRRAADDKTGEIIWLEKYVKLYTHAGHKNKTWSFDQSLRFSQYVLNKFEEMNRAEKEPNNLVNTGMVGQQKSCISPNPPMIKRKKY